MDKTPTVDPELLSTLSRDPWSARSLGYKVLGAGCSRVVLDLGDDFVLKVDTNTNFRGMEHYQNKMEWMTWEGASEAQRKFLCPIVMHDEMEHCWTIMRKAEQPHMKDEINPTVFQQDENAFIAAAQAAGLQGLWDMNGRNLGYIDGRLVAVDYGVD